LGRTNSKSNTKKSKPKANDKMNPDIVGIIYMATGLILAVAIYTSFAGVLSKLAQNISYALIGIGSYTLPIYLLYFGFQYIKTRGTICLKNKKIIGISLFVVIIMLTCGIINIQALYDPNNFIENIKSIAANESRVIHGGIFSYLICYPLYKFVGSVGSYILFFALSLIAVILIFDITLYDLGLTVASKSEQIKNNRKKKTIKKEPVDNSNRKRESSFINIVDKDEESSTSYLENREKEEFLQGVNRKIKILDFMKNADEEESDIAVGEDLSSRHVQKTNDIKEFIDDKIEPEKKTSSKKKNLDNEVKDVVNKEIEEHISEHKEEKEYKIPSLDLLKANANTKLNSSDKKELIENANKLEEILSNFGVDAKVIQVTKGPSVTRFELQPSPGVKVSKIVNLSDDIALGLAASGIRIEAPIPGKAAVGIEVPNGKQSPVFLREVLENDEFINSNKKLSFALGKDISGKCVVGDLSKMPHTLIAGATGSGKSVCINSLIISLLYKYKPEEVKLLMVDPKVVELSVYNGIPHLLIPVVTDPKKAAAALNWAVNEMTNRYKLFAEKGVRNMESYNDLYKKGAIEEKLPYIVIIVDELADLMMVCPNDVEDYIGRLAQMARAAGMHLVIATQRPSVDVITGVIKANIPSRISFAVSSQIDSRTILDSSGAEKLLGKGDMLYCPVGENKPLRIQGCFISEEEVENVISYIKNDQGDINYEEDIIEHINNTADSANSISGDNNDNVDELLNEAISTVIEYGQASTSFLQRRLRVGFNRASRIMEQLEERKIISEKDGSKPRQVLVTKEQLFGEQDNSIDD